MSTLLAAGLILLASGIAYTTGYVMASNRAWAEHCRSCEDCLFFKAYDGG